MYNDSMQTAHDLNRIQTQPTSSVRLALVELQTLLRQLYGAHAPVMLVYGSFARGQATADSDVDVVLIYPKDILPGTEIYRLREILSNLNLRYQVLISVLPVEKQHDKTFQTTFWKNVRREAVSFDRI